MRQAVMDSWIPRKNIERYRKLLDVARSPGESATLLSLIEVEQQKLAELDPSAGDGRKESKSRAADLAR
jgi:hypothetical protein